MCNGIKQYHNLHCNSYRAYIIIYRATLEVYYNPTLHFAYIKYGYLKNVMSIICVTSSNGNDVMLATCTFDGWDGKIVHERHYRRIEYGRVKPCLRAVWKVDDY